MIQFNNNGTTRFLKAILMDMDGVVTDSMPWHFECWKEVFKRRGVNLEKADVYRREGEKGIVSVMNIFAEKGLEIQIEDGLRMLQEKEDLFRSIAKVGTFKDIEVFADKISKAGTLMALVTGTSRSEMKRLLTNEMQSVFYSIVTGDMLERGKPDPAPYLKALAMLGVSAEDSIAVENAPLGILSAKGAGIFTIAVQTSLGPEYLCDADLIVPNHAALYGLFQN
jgi:beta-phosphoglucomutase